MWAGRSVLACGHPWWFAILSGMTRVLDRFEELARTPLRGYVGLGVRAAETLYEHSREMADMARDIVPRHYPAISAGHVAEMCMVHGLSELVPTHIVPRRDRNGWKHNAIAHLEATTGPTALMKQVGALCHEYIDNQTPAAQVANQIDALQTVSRLLRYEQTHPHFDLEVLWHLQRSAIKDPPLEQAFKELFDQRPADVGQRQMGEFVSLNEATLQRARSEVADRIGDFTPLLQERQQALAHYPFSQP